ncbi:hypothetical protein PsorP6_009794 [Peronosclerospora sorghi]|uniref:Uncharacterized protein n=1 Tax=Peronosclerospora sorghi TaxID=230839 RepID=A0ACC0W0X3_9STRA|nr:hypothetical protein PsorP6_009794 [Peronosclerospora sorghi]
MQPTRERRNMNDSHASNVSASSLNTTTVPHASDASAIKYTKTTSSTDGETCTWYSNSICARPRSCFDCLNVILPGESCALNPYGVCMNAYLVSSMDGYDMTNYSYCSAEDSVCSACQAKWTRMYQAGEQVVPNAQCVGASGCICLAACEQPDRDSYIVGIWCVPALSSSQFRVVAVLIAGSIAFFVLVAMLIKRHVWRRPLLSRRNRSGHRSETLRPAASAHLPRLSLSGWARMREKLVSSEQHVLRGGTSSTYPTLDRTKPIRPAIVDEEEDEGDDIYRSLSPNDTPTRREL